MGIPISFLSLFPSFKSKNKSIEPQLLPFAFDHEAYTLFRAGLLFKRDSFPDNYIDWTNENVSFGAPNYECLSKKRSTFCSRVVQV